MCTHTHTCTHIPSACPAVQTHAAGDLIPNTTRVDVVVASSRDDACCSLLLKTSHEEAVIRGVVVFGEQIFPEESLFFYLPVSHAVA